MTIATTTYGESAARDRLSGEWDADGTVSVHLPRDVAERLLAERGWRWQPNLSWESPSGKTYWEVDEALAVALIAENE